MLLLFLLQALLLKGEELETCQARFGDTFEEDSCAQYTESTCGFWGNFYKVILQMEDPGMMLCQGGKWDPESEAVPIDASMGDDDVMGAEMKEKCCIPTPETCGGAKEYTTDLFTYMFSLFAQMGEEDGDERRLAEEDEEMSEEDMAAFVEMMVVGSFCPGGSWDNESNDTELVNFDMLFLEDDEEKAPLMSEIGEKCCAPLTCNSIKEMYGMMIAQSDDLPEDIDPEFYIEMAMCPGQQWDSDAGDTLVPPSDDPENPFGGAGEVCCAPLTCNSFKEMYGMMIAQSDDLPEDIDPEFYIEMAMCPGRVWDSDAGDTEIPPSDDPENPFGGAGEVCCKDMESTCGGFLAMLDSYIASGIVGGSDLPMICLSGRNPEATDTAMTNDIESEEFWEELETKCCLPTVMNCDLIENLINREPDDDMSPESFCGLSEWDTTAGETPLTSLTFNEMMANEGPTADILEEAMQKCCTASTPDCASYKNAVGGDRFCPLTSWDDAADAQMITTKYWTQFEGDEEGVPLRKEVYETCCVAPTNSTCGDYWAIAENYGIKEHDICYYSNRKTDDNTAIESIVHENTWKSEMFEKCCEPIECTSETQGIKNIDGHYCCTKDGVTEWNADADEEADCTCGQPTTYGSACFGEDFSGDVEERKCDGSPKFGYENESEDGDESSEEFDDWFENPAPYHLPLARSCPDNETNGWDSGNTDSDPESNGGEADSDPESNGGEADSDPESNGNAGEQVEEEQPGSCTCVVWSDSEPEPCSSEQVEEEQPGHFCVAWSDDEETEPCSSSTILHIIATMVTVALALAM